jgi:hypothetical protein
MAAMRQRQAMLSERSQSFFKQDAPAGPAGHKLADDGQHTRLLILAGCTFSNRIAKKHMGSWLLNVGMPDILTERVEQLPRPAHTYKLCTKSLSLCGTQLTQEHN